jgi:4-diphosphocytidyl-2-C-methyl-D-erythritol kinase
MSLTLTSPAKINLFLYVTGKRPDGYHTLLTLMCGVRLYDGLTLSFGGKGVDIECDHPQVPADADNLAYKAAALFFKEVVGQKGGRQEGVVITLEKKIPVGAGLGGGSSNAASVLLGLNQYYGYPFSNEELRTLGLTLGADVPFFIYERPAIARGIGEILEPAPSLRPFSVLLVYPGIHVSTGLVYKKLNLGLTKLKKENKNLPFKIRVFNPKNHLWNDLEAATMPLVPEISRIKRLLADHGAEGTLMSGSGSAVFGIYSDLKDAMAAKESLQSDHEHWQVYAVDALV